MRDKKKDKGREETIKAKISRNYADLWNMSLLM